MESANYDPPTHWKYNRLDPYSEHELSEWAINPVWKHFRHYRSINTSRCLIVGCGFTRKTHSPKTLVKHLEKYHPAEHLQFAMDYPEYDLKRNKEYLPYRRSSVRGLSKQTSSSQSATYQAFDSEVDIADIQEAHNTSQDIESEDDDVIFIQEVPKHSLLTHSNKHTLLEEADEFSLMAKIVKLPDHSFELALAVAYYSKTDNKRKMSILGNEAIDTSTTDMILQLQTIAKQVFGRHHLDFDCIRHSIVECADLIGIANNIDIFPNQVKSYRDKLHLIEKEIDDLIEKHSRPGSVDRWLGPIVYYKNLVSSEINAIEHVNASRIGRVFPFITNLLNELQNERFDWRVELSQFIWEEMSYAVNLVDVLFNDKFIIASVLNPATITYLDEDQKDVAVQVINEVLEEESDWITEVMEESTKIGEMSVKERLNYNYLRFWKQRSIKYPTLSSTANGFYAMPSSVYICNI